MVQGAAGQAAPGGAQNLAKDRSSLAHKLLPLLTDFRACDLGECQRNPGKGGQEVVVRTDKSVRLDVDQAALEEVQRMVYVEFKALDDVPHWVLFCGRRSVPPRLMRGGGGFRPERWSGHCACT